MRASLLNSYAATGWTPILISNEVPYVRATIKGPLLVGACAHADAPARVRQAERPRTRESLVRVGR